MIEKIVVIWVKQSKFRSWIWRFRYKKFESKEKARFFADKINSIPFGAFVWGYEVNGVERESL